MLLAEGPSPKALVPGPLHVGMSQGLVVRFEEITRCPAEIQDVLISFISEKLMMIPELPQDQRMLLAKPGFNIIATANIRDRGVHEMSSALKRRFNFETVPPIGELAQEVNLVSEQCQRLLANVAAKVAVERDVVEVLVTAIHETLGKWDEDRFVKRLPSLRLALADLTPHFSVRAGFRPFTECYGNVAQRAHARRRILHVLSPLSFPPPLQRTPQTL